MSVADISRSTLVPPLLAGGAAALLGAYWDDAWHTDRGRDSFFIAPHVLIYGGISLAGAIVALALIPALRQRGWRGLLAEPPLQLGAVAIVATLGAAPIDNAWHVAFGRDAVLWSPPHVLGIVGSAGLGVAALTMIVAERARWARLLRPLAGGFVLAAFTFLVVEYETDVPQFAPFWYLPVLAALAAFALCLVRVVSRERLAGTTAATAQLAFVALVAVLLLALGFDAPKLPLLVVPALALDLTAGRPAPLRGALFSAALFLVYVPTLAWAGSGVELGAGDVAGGLLAAAVATSAVVAVVEPTQHGRRLGTRHAVTAATLLSLVFAATAYAHDPGQGDAAGSMDLQARVSGTTVAVDATYLRGDRCAGVRPIALVARRAGEVRRAPLAQTGCRFSGSLRLSGRGRWFVYATLRSGAQTIESWLPVKLGAGEASFAAPRRFAYVAAPRDGGATQTAVAIVIYTLAAAFLVWVVRLTRRGAGIPV